MQFKLLQLYISISTFSTNMISVFIPFLVYEHTGSLLYAFLYYIVEHVINIILHIAFRKQLFKNPQLFLLLRIIPIVLFQVILMFLSAAPMLVVILAGTLSALNCVFRFVPTEIVYNYSTEHDSKTENLAIISFFDQVGYIAALVLGGVLLDNLNYIYVLIISLVLYLVASLPLFLFWLNNRKNPYFNKEFISVAHIKLQENDNQGKNKNISKKILLNYFFHFMLIGCLEMGYIFFGFAIYFYSSSYAILGILGGVFNALYAINSLVVGKLDEKKDITIYAVISFLIIAVSYIIMSLISPGVIGFVLYEVIAFVYPFSFIFLQQRMLIKTRILGVSNYSILLKNIAQLVGESFAICFAFISVYAVVFVSGVCTFISGLTLKHNEEKTRKLLVNYLEDNEI